MSRGYGKAGSTMTKEMFHIMMHVLFNVLTKGKYSLRFRKQVGVYWVRVGVDFLNVHRHSLLNLKQKAGINTKEWVNTASQDRDLRTFQMLTTTLIKCFEDGKYFFVLKHHSIDYELLFQSFSFF